MKGHLHYLQVWGENHFNLGFEVEEAGLIQFCSQASEFARGGRVEGGLAGEDTDSPGIRQPLRTGLGTQKGQEVVEAERCKTRINFTSVVRLSRGI